MSRDCPFCGDCEACQRTLRNEDKLTKAQKRVAELEAGFVGPGDVSCPKGGLIAAIAAAISAERSAGLSDGGKDRKATGELSDAPKPAPACARCGGSGEIDDPVTINPACGGYVESSSPCPDCRGKP